MSKLIQAIIFDMDGLMFDTEMLNNISWKEAGRAYGFEIPDDLLKSHIGTSMETSKKLMLERLGQDFDFHAVREERIARSMQYIKEKGMPLKPGLRELLAYLKDNRLKTAIATSSAESFVRFYLQRADLKHEFDVIICGDQVKNSKPEPDIFLAALAKLELNANQCLILEDSYNGIIAAHRAGIKSVMIPDLLPPTPEIEKLFFCKANILTDVISIIESIK